MKPTEFFIGVVDLFAILLPGAIATWIAIHFSESHGLPLLVSMGLGEVSGVPSWLAFFVGSYILGHFAHTVSSYVDHVGWVRNRCQQRVSEVEPRAKDSKYAFKEAIAFLVIAAPHALTEVRRLEADSKFFRSLFVVLLLVFLRLLFGLNTVAHRVAALVCLVLIALSLICYCLRREKAIVLAIRLHRVAVEQQRVTQGAKLALADAQE